jgi:hypothetical protein
MSATADIAVIIPVFDDAPALERLLTSIVCWPTQPAEIIVVAAGPEPTVAALCASHRCRLLVTRPCRGEQLDAGARAATARILWFVHADADLPNCGIADILHAYRAGAEAGYFRFEFSGAPYWRARLIAALVGLRQAFGGVAYGDQGLWIDADAYAACGGFAHEPLFEEVRLFKRLRIRGRLTRLPTSIGVSARRWQRDGWLTRSAKNRALALRHALGASAMSLAASYGPESRATEDTKAVNRAANRTMVTPDGEPVGYIQPTSLRELWFHTGTACNLSCPFCLEGSKPGDGRLDRITLRDARPLIDEAVALGVEQLSFTGGEPFIVKDFVNILRYASTFRPCLVLTNGTDPVLKRIAQIETLVAQPHPVAFRISIDFPNEQRHDAGRGAGSFAKAWQSLALLQRRGFRVSIARQAEKNEDAAAVDAAFRRLAVRHGLPAATTIVAFPDFLTPGAAPVVPQITEHCMTTYHSAESRGAFMCAFSKMVIKKQGAMRVYACTLVDDDESYDLGGSLAESLGKRILLHHHRCYSCFAYGSSCSEIDR